MTGTSHSTVSCKVCGSNHTVRIGRIYGIQRWQCRDCGKRFMDNGARFGMKTPVLQVALAIRWYYQGMSLNAIRQKLNKEFNNYPSDSTIYHWINKYTDIAINKSKYYHPDVGTTWIADETKLNNCEKPTWIWDILDQDTWFLIATQVIFERSPAKAQSLVRHAVMKAGTIPKVIRTNRLAAYFSDVKLHYSDCIKHPEIKTNVIEDDTTDELERFHRELKWRTSHMSNLRGAENIIKYNEGWLIYHNYFTPKTSLGGKTPAEAARTNYPVINHNGIRISRS